MSITCPTCIVSSDCNKTEMKTLNLFGSSDTVPDSALNGPSVSRLDCSTSSNVSLEMTSSLYKISTISEGRVSCERDSECFCSSEVATSF